MKVAVNVGPQSIAMCVSTTGSQGDSYAKIMKLFQLAERLGQSGTPLLAWRQGIYGPALVAAGRGGYETGVGTRETCDISSSISSRRPPKDANKKKGGAVPGIYVEPLKRSVPARIGLALLGDRAMRPKVMCDDERCCPNGAADTIDHRREHAIRTRARELVALDSQPHRAWRLHQISKDAEGAADLARQVSVFLQRAGMTDRINPKSMDELARVAQFLKEREQSREAA